MSDSKTDATPEPAAKRQRTDRGESEEMLPVLHSYWRSSCSYRVRIALNLKGIRYEYRPVHLLKEGGQHLQDKFTKLNPSKLLPALEIDGMTLSQSWPVIEYLDETRPTPRLLPEQPAARFKVRQLAAIIACDTQPVQNLRVLKRVSSLVSEDKEARRNEWGRTVIEDGFSAFEALASKYAGKYSVGDEVTLADLCLVPQIYNANRFSVDMTRYPTIQRVFAALEELPEVKAAHPSVQPDADT